ncbi:MAG TPA: PD-(D/E)XK nuclease family protein [Caldimonas sp.]|jgi:ATP-dependent helicase/nuclease subunit B|nr:PD-(D/E)XK nuclease family protein [Caldimonas sp.]HEX4235096.1 PD-(D/E)XK nuclease family protein [Caldimonas sp.]
MASIVDEAVNGSIDKPWDAIAHRVVGWAEAAGLALRDVVVLVPFLQLLTPARRAFAAVGGWMPRIETTRTLAAATGPDLPRGSGEIGWGFAHDTLLAMQMLSRQAWVADWPRRDPRGFAQAAARVVTVADELMTAAANVPPGDRVDWWARGRELLRPLAGPGSRERLLAQVALEWAARSRGDATDRLFALRPAGWVAVTGGGADALVDALLRHGTTPALRIRTDVDPAQPFADVPSGVAPAFRVCDGFEDEASAAAAQVLAHVERGETPVALIAQDRVLVRRVRALLERQDVVLRDETGWKLATTRAGASIMALLLAVRRDAAADTWLDWLKSAPFGATRTSALESLEAAARKAQVAEASALARLDLEPGAAALREEATAIVSALARPSRRSFVDWLDALAAALGRSGVLARLRDDAAGRQALTALGLEPPLEPGRRAQLGADLEPLTLAEFTRWVDDLLERETFRPPDPVDADAGPLPAEVVVTPLARAMLRPFAAAVLPGADDRRLGGGGAIDSLLANATRRALGLPEPSTLRDAELLAFAQLLRLPRVTLLRRRADGADPLGNSVFVERLSLALAARGARLGDWLDPRRERSVDAAPIRKGAPSVPATRLPTRLSATTFKALRDCPYRFFAQSVLGLRAAEELDSEVEKRDYGKWLHEVLHAFHLGREAGADVGVDIARLLAIGAASREAQGLDEASFLPFSASFEVLVPRYVAWLHERETAGAAWARGEVDLRIRPEALGGVELHGRVDRIDSVDGGARLELIDYKTGSSSQLKKDVADRFEDTQLAFYAALVGAESELPLRAFYLALDATKGLDTHEHQNVATSADALLAGIADDLSRLREGAGLPPLGEGSACAHCDARGLCRRDHWTVEAAGNVVGGDREGNAEDRSR